MPKIGIIAGTGWTDFPGLEDVNPRLIFTRYGWLKVKEKGNLVFLLRHGFDYKVPHRINNRANIMALKKLKVDYILATAACGSLRKDIKPGEFAVLSDFVDFTRGRVETFEPGKKPSYLDMSEPYSKRLNERIVKAAKELEIHVHENLVYACVEGPRFETKAEIRAYQTLGCDVVGMTQVPEVILAREVNIPYAALAIITNYAAGLQEKISADEVVTMVQEKNQQAAQIILRVISYFSSS